MLMDLFLWPGRLAARLFGRKKVHYRSRRPRPEMGGGLVLLSLALWLAGAGTLLFALDRTGLLKGALDAGVEMAQGEKSAEPDPPPPDPLPDTGELIGPLNPPGPDPAQVQAAVAAEMWLVILHSIPKTARAEAERRQAGYKAKGLEVDILDTNAFPRLPSNYWIIALGPFDDRAGALAAADQAKTFNSGLMVRRGL